MAATRDIPKGRIICDYSGEVYRADEAEKLFSSMTKSEERHARDYAVEYEEMFGGTFYIFAHFPEKIKSFGRLLNHSALHPNCRVYPKYISRPRKRKERHEQQSKSRIFVVETTRKVSAGEELVWNYGPKYAQRPWFYTCHCRRCVDVYYRAEPLPKASGINNIRLTANSEFQHALGSFLFLLDGFKVSTLEN